MEKKRLGIVGCGHLGNIVTDAICQGLLPEYELVGVLGRDEEHARLMAEKAAVRFAIVWKNFWIPNRTMWRRWPRFKW